MEGVTAAGGLNAHEDASNTLVSQPIPLCMSPETEDLPDDGGGGGTEAVSATSANPATTAAPTVAFTLDFRLEGAAFSLAGSASGWLSLPPADSASFEVCLAAAAD